MTALSIATIVGLGALLRLPPAFILLPAAVVGLTAVVGADNAAQFAAGRISGTLQNPALSTIAMLALAGELNRVMGAGAATQRLAQSIFAGWRAAPLLAPLVGVALQGPLYLRSGRALMAESAQDAKEMVPAMAAQGVPKLHAWAGLAAGGTCALAWPVGYVAVIAAIAFGQSTVRVMLSLMLPWVILIALFATCAILASRSGITVQAAPVLGSPRVYFIWRDYDTVSRQLTSPLFVMGAIFFGLTTSSEIGALVAMSGFAIAWLQPLRPRFKDLIAAFTQAAIVSIELCFLIAAADLFASSVSLLVHPSEIAGYISGLMPPGLVSTICFALIAALAFVLGIPAALVLCAPLLAALMPNWNMTPTTVCVVCFALLGATLREILLAPGGSATGSLSNRLTLAAFWCIPIAILIAAILLRPEITLSLPRTFIG